jgi:tetratricopeptide (TPR) repeat protein
MLKDVSQKLAGRDVPSRTNWKLLALFAGVLLAAVGQRVYLRLSRPDIHVPAPPDPARLDPYLRQYVEQKVAWARELPDDPSREATLGLVYAANALWLEAAQAFQNVVRLEPKEPLAVLYLAVANQELGQSDRALQLLRDLTARFPEFAPGFFRLGDYSLRAGDVEGAGRAFQRLSELAPNEWRGFSGLGEVKLRQGQIPEAVRLLEKAVQLDVGAKPAHALLGQAYQRAGRTNEATRELATGMNASHFPMPDAWSEQAPRHMRLPFDLIELAQGYIKAGAPAKAASILEPTAALHQDNPTLLVTLAEAYVLSGRPRQAQPVLDQVLKVDPVSVPAYVALSGCDLAQGWMDRALSNASRAVSLGTNHAEAYVAMANAHLALEHDRAAVEALEAAHRCDSNNPQVLLDLGDILWRNLGQTNQALEAYSQATTIDPASVPAHVRMAQLLISNGDPQGARTNLETAHQLAPKDPTIAAALEKLKGAAPP